jgi:hypothetical protein
LVFASVVFTNLQKRTLIAFSSSALEGLFQSWKLSALPLAEAKFLSALAA